ncbi:autotransporter domain-containing protein [Fusobacterium ulcerans]|uniref:Autotransporter domain-containing protein n=1 Tax=Fusobacterium ulcerans TaxID=861 RepID=A0AAX2J8J1_9FUSO|nr:hypothetical protein [Fusobacterium ulcerans]AVQ28715.1 autotransporter domain-containing protein [Fusobacterium ulcerans]EFS26191.2 hypothetical protein FUAG_01706 [Fusobacterium ulcerans ATCC 49185]SQJ00610.1 Uncharacterised protein [Fusobacterium ulcerans]
MIEKIMKAVKSGNKKRGRNITVGAVVGMLLSCTAVMGTDVSGLEITKDSDIIIFKGENGNEFDPEKLEGNPYPDNTWANNTYTNNSSIVGENASGNAYGVKVSESISIVNNGEIRGSSENGHTYGIGISEDIEIKKLENNGMIISYSESNGDSHGITIGMIGKSAKVTELINRGFINATSTEGESYGISTFASVEIDNLINDGLIRGTTRATGEKNGYGIKVFFGSKVNSLTNDGLVIGTAVGGEGYGIEIKNSKDFSDSSAVNVENIKNNGIISGTSTDNDGYGILIGDSVDGGLVSVGKILNNGIISGSSSVEDHNKYGYGIFVGSNHGGGPGIVGQIENNGIISGNGFVESVSSSGISTESDSKISEMVNKGIIYGKKYAISVAPGTIESAKNYGILVSNNADGDVVNSYLEIIAPGESPSSGASIENYGLAFLVDGDVYKAKDNYGVPYNKFGEKQTVGEYTIINAKNTGNNDDIKTVSMKLKNGILFHDNSDTSRIKDFSSEKKYILNGIEDTLKVSGMENELNNSVINAYKTAVVINENMSMLTLDNTVVNGGVADGSTTISITENGSTLTVKGDSVINTRDKGVAITVDGNDNAVVLEGNAIVNGKMEAAGKDNILALYGKTKGSMNMFHDISGFADMNIDNNVTFSEEMTVTGTDRVTVEGTGVLNLRLKKETPVTSPYGTDTPPTATHAFSGRSGKHKMTIEGSGEVGTLNFITNGIGREILVDMENIKLENMQIRASSIIDKAEFDGNYIRLGAGSDLNGIVNPKEVKRYGQLNKIYKSIYNSREENIDGLRDILSLSTYLGKNYDYNNITDEEQLLSLVTYLNSVYTGTPYSYSSELSRRSVGMFRDIVVDNIFRPETNKWLIMGGLTHADGGTKDTYYGRNYHGFDTGTSDTSADMKLTGAYMLAKYGYSENTSLGLTLGGNKSEAELDMAKVKGNSGYLGAFAENYRGNLTLKVGAGVGYKF